LNFADNLHLISKKMLMYLFFDRYEEKYFIRMSTPKQEKVCETSIAIRDKDL